MESAREPGISGAFADGGGKREDYCEERIIAFGLSEAVVLRVVYIIRDHVIRMITAQRANRNDREKYYRFVFHG